MTVTDYQPGALKPADGIDLPELVHRALSLYRRIQSCDFSSVIAHFRNTGQDAEAAHTTLITVLQFICLANSWKSLGGKTPLALPGDVQRASLRDFVIDAQGLRQVEQRLPEGQDYNPVTPDGDTALTSALLSLVFRGQETG